jgi:hypothetical protein
MINKPCKFQWVFLIRIYFDILGTFWQPFVFIQCPALFGDCARGDNSIRVVYSGTYCKLAICFKICKKLQLNLAYISIVLTCYWDKDSSIVFSSPKKFLFCAHCLHNRQKQWNFTSKMKTYFGVPCQLNLYR